ncbi:MAG: nucleotidyltransferase family protein [Rhodocyclaceae bacterium]|nr:nucleotidyltransferase family protein [Rhodocyclaceae bacterium]
MLNKAEINQPLLITVLRFPGTAASLDEASWGLLIRQARNANVIGRMLSAVEPYVACHKWPLRAREAFIAEKNIADHRFASLIWEVEELAQILASENTRPILLKGAAYALEKKPFARFRNFGDIDLLVPLNQLAAVERALVSNGWLTTKADSYDQYYYRRWMHELPPMQHIHRGTNLDVHHAILPLTARYKPDSDRLIASARPSTGMASVDVLAPEDMFLHGAAHLFCEGECENALRNLLDLHDLWIDLFEDKSSVVGLVNRAVDLDLTVVLALAGRYMEHVLDSKNAGCIAGVMRDKGVMPQLFTWHDWLFDAIFLGFHPSCQQKGQALARQVLYLRSHYLRMPFYLLVQHLLRKAWREVQPVNG